MWQVGGVFCMQGSLGAGGEEKTFVLFFPSHYICSELLKVEESRLGVL